MQLYNHLVYVYISLSVALLYHDVLHPHHPESDIVWYDMYGHTLLHPPSPRLLTPCISKTEWKVTSVLLRARQNFHSPENALWRI